ncbi:MAG: HAMP domain-containing protein [Candidatus Omnitrophica bacterium]|nr:HAMP domain-containing protein [Candidatus Omnitrophota bacterium]
MNFKSIRFKIFSSYAAILIAILWMFSVLVYSNQKKILLDDVDQLLLLKAQDIVDAIAIYQERERDDSPGAGPAAVENQADFAAMTQRWVKEKAEDPKLNDIIVRIYGPNGRILASSVALPAPLALAWNFFNQGQGEKAFFQTVKTHFASGEPEEIRFCFIPISNDSLSSFAVEVGKPLASAEKSLYRLRQTMVFLFPLAVVLSGVAVFFLSGVLLNPLNQVIRTVRQIRAENLALRIRVPDTGDEIRHLAETFNRILEDLEQAFTSQKQLIQDISHELRTPLTILKGEIEVILKKNRPVDEYKAVLQGSLEEVNRIYRMVENLLTLSRFDSHEVSLASRPVALGDLLNEVITDMKTVARQKGMTLRYDSKTAGAVFVTGDEQHLRRAFLNILDNAIKYSPAGQAVDVTLSLTPDGSLVEAAIRDRGEGIAPEHLPYIFNRFYRADPSRGGPGYGLGLSLVKTIIEAHRGTIQLQSLPRQGTTVIVALPIIKKI